MKSSQTGTLRRQLTEHRCDYYCRHEDPRPIATVVLATLLGLAFGILAYGLLV